MEAALIVKAQEIVEGFREKYPQVRQPNDPVDFEEFKKKFLANPFNVQMHLIFTE